LEQTLSGYFEHGKDMKVTSCIFRLHKSAQHSWNLKHDISPFKVVLYMASREQKSSHHVWHSRLTSVSSNTYDDTHDDTHDDTYDDTHDDTHDDTGQITIGETDPDDRTVLIHNKGPNNEPGIVWAQIGTCDDDLVEVTQFVQVAFQMGALYTKLYIEWALNFPSPTDGIPTKWRVGAFYEGRMVGFAAAHHVWVVMRQPHGPYKRFETSYVDLLSVEKAHRGKKIAADLIVEIARRITLDQVGTAFFSSDRGNVPLSIRSICTEAWMGKKVHGVFPNLRSSWTKFQEDKHLDGALALISARNETKEVYFDLSREQVTHMLRYVPNLCKTWVMENGTLPETLRGFVAVHEMHKILYITEMAAESRQALQECASWAEHVATSRQCKMLVMNTMVLPYGLAVENFTGWTLMPSDSRVLFGYNLRMPETTTTPDKMAIFCL
jgi:GNAT superfamily N-acetyltransferase